MVQKRRLPLWPFFGHEIIADLFAACYTPAPVVGAPSPLPASETICSPLVGCVADAHPSSRCAWDGP